MSRLEVRNDIKTVVKGLGHTLSDLSRALGMNYDSLSAYVNGRRRMTPELAERIEKQLLDWENGI